jgi:hypothetical protein
MSEDYAELLLSLGQTSGMLSRPELFEQLVASLRTQALDSGHLLYLRGKLDAALQAAGHPDPG